MENPNFNIIGLIFICTSLLDSTKYRWNASKIQKLKSSRGHSRNFINVALLNDVVRTMYGVSIGDWYIIGCSILAFVFMAEYFWAIYWWYPYRYRNLKNFKRPNLFVYLWNSILPNNISKKL